MLARQRQERILEQVRRHGGARVGDLVSLLGVSDMTIRRDIAALARRGLVERVHGGATAPEGGNRSAGSTPLAPGTPLPGHYAPESGTAAPETTIRVDDSLDPLGRAAAALVRPGQRIALGGPTSPAVARHLRGVPGLTVITNSVTAAALLPAAEVLLTGGRLTASGRLVGPLATHTLAGLHADLALLGVEGVHPSAGATVSDVAEAEVAHALAADGTAVVLLAAASAWGRLALASVASWAQVSAWVTDVEPSGQARAHLDGLGIDLVVAQHTAGGSDLDQVGAHSPVRAGALR
ncbi:MAG: DeoR/GlpR family DNA-binding transcription regulator [Kineosporiaceae bacterium]